MHLKKKKKKTATNLRQLSFKIVSRRIVASYSKQFSNIRHNIKQREQANAARRRSVLGEEKLKCVRNQIALSVNRNPKQLSFP